MQKEKGEDFRTWYYRGAFRIRLELAPPVQRRKRTHGEKRKKVKKGPIRFLKGRGTGEKPCCGVPPKGKSPSRNYKKFQKVFEIRR